MTDSMGSKSSSVSAAVVMSGANVFNNAITFFSGVLLAKHFGSTEYAQFAVAMQLVLLSNVVFECGLGVAYVRYGSAGTASQLASLSRHVIWLRAGVLALGLVSLAVVAPLMEPAAARLGLKCETFLLSIASGMVLTLWGHCRSSFHVSGRFSTYASYVVLFAALRLAGLAMLLAAGFGGDSHSAILALYVVPASLLVAARFATQKPDFSLPSFVDLKRDAVRLFGYSKYIAISALTYPLIASSPLFLMPALDPVSFRANYGLALALSSIVAPVNEAIRGVLLRKVSLIEAPSEAIALLDFYKRSAPVFGVFFIAIIGLTHVFFEIYLSDQYPGAAIPIRTLLAANLVVAFLGSISSLAHFLRRPDWDAKNNLVRVALVSLVCVASTGRMDADSCAALVGIVLVAGESIVAFQVVSGIRRRRNA